MSSCGSFAPLLCCCCYYGGGGGGGGGVASRIPGSRSGRLSPFICDPAGQSIILKIPGDDGVGIRAVVSSLLLLFLLLLQQVALSISVGTKRQETELNSNEFGFRIGFQGCFLATDLALISRKSHASRLLTTPVGRG